MGYYAGKPLEIVNCFYEINFKIVSTSWVNRCFNRKAFDQSGRSSVSAIIQKGMYDCSFELNFQSDVTTLWTDFMQSFRIVELLSSSETKGQIVGRQELTSAVSVLQESTLDEREKDTAVICGRFPFLGLSVHIFVYLHIKCYYFRCKWMG